MLQMLDGYKLVMFGDLIISKMILSLSGCAQALILDPSTGTFPRATHLHSHCARRRHSLATMGSVFPVLAMLVVTVALMTCAALFVPKGPNQVYVLSIANVLVLTLV